MTDRTKELKYRLEAKMKEVEKELTQAQADAHGAKNDGIEKLEAKLGEMKNHLKENWENLSEDAINKINALLK